MDSFAACPHLTQQHLRGLGSHTCLDCGELLSVDMAHDLGTGNQWSGAGGRPAGKQHVTARVMLQELHAASEPAAKVRKVPGGPGGPGGSSLLKKGSVKLHGKLKELKPPAASLPPPPKPSGRVPKPKPAESVNMNHSAVATQPVVLAVVKVKKVKAIVVETAAAPIPAPEVVKSTLTALSTPSLIALPTTVIIPVELHLEADRLSRALGRAPGKPQRGHTRLAFACVFTACEKLGAPRSALTLSRQFGLSRSDVTEGLGQFTALCPQEERASILGRDVHFELRALMQAQQRCSVELMEETLELLRELVVDLRRTSPMFDPKDELQQGRKRLALGVLHYWECWLEPNRSLWPAVHGSPLFPQEQVMEVVREVDRCRGKELFG